MKKRVLLLITTAFCLTGCGTKEDGGNAAGTASATEEMSFEETEDRSGSETVVDEEAWDEYAKQEQLKMAWKTAYLEELADILQGCRDYSGYDETEIELADINGDQIPEVFVRRNHEVFVSILSYIDGDVERLVADACGGLYYNPNDAKILCYCEGGDACGEGYCVHCLTEQGFELVAEGGIYNDWREIGEGENARWVMADRQFIWDGRELLSSSDFYYELANSFDYTNAIVFEGDSMEDSSVAEYILKQ